MDIEDAYPILESYKDRKGKAIVFDIDDTLISSFGSRLIMQNKELYDKCILLGYTVFIVSARSTLSTTRTKKQLKQLGIQGYKNIFLMPRGKYCASDIEKGTFKELMRKKITGKGYEVILNVGDDPSDFYGKYYKYSFRV